MRGWPIMQALAVVVVMLLLALPLRRLTAPRLEKTSTAGSEVAAPTASPSPLPTTETVRIGLFFTRPPARFSVKFLGTEVLSGAGTAVFELEKPVEMEFPPEGIDLVVSAEWTAHFQRQTLQLRVIRADGRTQTRVFEGKRRIEEIVTFPGTP